MPTTYSPKDTLPMQEGGDINDIAVFVALRDALDGKLFYPCTSTTRPAGTARFTGRMIVETDTKAFGLWDGTAWRMWDTVAQAYTPTWSSTGTAPVLSNGTITGEYVRAGSLWHWRAVITPGSSTTFGSGEYTITLPTTCRGAETGPVGDAYMYASAYREGTVSPVSGTTAKVYFDATPTTAWSATSPVTFASGHKMTLAGSFITP